MDSYKLYVMNKSLPFKNSTRDFTDDCNAVIDICEVMDLCQSKCVGNLVMAEMIFF